MTSILLCSPLTKLPGLDSYTSTATLLGSYTECYQFIPSLSPLSGEGVTYSFIRSADNLVEATFTFSGIPKDKTSFVIPLQSSWFRLVGTSLTINPEILTFTIPQEYVAPVVENTAADLNALSVADYYSEIVPTELYSFTWLRDNGATVQVSYTSGNTRVIDSGIEYYPETIKRGEIEMTMEVNKSVLRITVTKNNAIAKLFLSGAPAMPITIKLFRTIDTTKICLFQGRVINCSFSGMEAVLACEPLYTHVQKAGLNRRYETLCSHSLYDPSTCKATKSGVTYVIGTDFTFETESTGRGKILTFTNPAFLAYSPEQSVNNTEVIKAGAFTGGMAQFTLVDSPEELHTQYGAYYWITSHRARELELSKPFPSNHLDKISAVTLYRGCDHSLTACAGMPKTDNSLTATFGGFPYMVPANPFVGSHVPLGGK